jgi:5-methylcytosine-specific restriction endonuclease McrA
MTKSIISKNLMYSVIICFVIVWFLRNRVESNPSVRREWTSQFEERSSLSWRDCLKSMSVAFLLGGESAEINLIPKEHSSTNNSQYATRNQMSNGLHVDQQGRSYRIGRGGRKIYKRKRLGERIRKVVAASQQWRCHDCNELLSASFEVDHVLPVSQGGTNDLSNLNALCRNCHGERTSRQGMEFNF